MNQRQQLLEQIRRESIQKRAQALREAAQRQAFNVPIAGAVSGGGDNRTQYWIQTLFAPESFNRQIYLQSLTMDSSGAVYSLSNPNPDSGAALLTRKFSNSGSLVWQYPVEAAGYQTSDSINPAKTLIYEGHLYSLYSTIITKQTLSGDLVWQSSWNADTGEGDVFTFAGFTVDLMGNLVVISTSNDATFVHSVSAMTGQVTKTVNVSIDVTPDRYFDAQPVIDSEGNIIVACNWVFPDYHSTIIKIDPTLTTVLSTFTMDENAFVGDCDVTALALDENDILYVVQYDMSMYALDTRTNEVLWTRQYDSFGNNAYHMTIAPTGEIYWVGEADWNDFGGDDGRNVVTIIKLDQSGNLDWATGIRYVPINDDFEVTGWESGSGTSGVQIVKDALLITAEVQLVGPDTETILKLPLTQVLGTYGDYEFFDITGQISFTSPPPAEIPVIALATTASNPTPIDYTPLPFALEQTKIIDKI